MKKETHVSNARGNAIIRKFKHCSNDVKVKLFNAYCENAYCCSLISQFKKCTFKSIKTAHNKIFKSLMRVRRDASASALFVQHEVDNFNVLMRKISFSLMQRVMGSNNKIVSTIGHSLFFYTSCLYQSWTKLLYVNSVT